MDRSARWHRFTGPGQPGITAGHGGHCQVSVFLLGRAGLSRTPRAFFLHGKHGCPWQFSLSTFAPTYKTPLVKSSSRAMSTRGQAGFLNGLARPCLGSELGGGVLQRWETLLVMATGCLSHPHLEEGKRGFPREGGVCRASAMHADQAGSAGWPLPGSALLGGYRAS